METWTTFQPCCSSPSRRPRQGASPLPTTAATEQGQEDYQEQNLTLRQMKESSRQPNKNACNKIYKLYMHVQFWENKLYDNQLLESWCQFMG